MVIFGISVCLLSVIVALLAYELHTDPAREIRRRNQDTWREIES